MIATFGHLFSGINIKRRTRTGTRDLKVPLHFANQSKIYLHAKDGGTGGTMTLPRMGFEFSIDGVDVTRKTSRSIIHNYKEGVEAHWSRNYVPYNFNFTLTIISDDIEDGLQIIEQILPRFQPELTVKIKPLADYPDFIVDIPIELTGVQNEFSGFGGDMERDDYIWTLNFTVKGYMFSPISTEGLGIIDVVNIRIDDWVAAKNGGIATGGPLSDGGYEETIE
jgi:hypothetical protein